MLKSLLVTVAILTFTGCGQIAVSSLFGSSPATPFTEPVELKPVSEALPNTYYTRKIQMPLGILPVSFSSESVDVRCEVEFSRDNGTSWSPALSGEAGDLILIRARFSEELAAPSTAVIRINEQSVSWEIQPSSVKKFALTQKLRQANANLNTYERFGSSASVSYDGSRILVAARTDKVGSVAEAGSMTLYEKLGESWNEIAFLTQTGGVAYEKAGSTISLSSNGQRAAMYAENGSGPTLKAGAVYLFWNDGGGWSQKQKITLTLGEEETGARFGHALSFSADGTRLVLSAIALSGAVSSEGAVFVYDFDPVTSKFVRTQKISPPASTSTSFGYAVRLSADGNTLVIARPYENETAVEQGFVYTYIKKQDGLFELQNKLFAPRKWAYQQFGRDLSINGDGSMLTVGGQAFDVQGNNAGVVFTFARNANGTWKFLNELSPPFPALSGATQFGLAQQLDTSGSRLVISARNGMNGAVKTGAIHAYVLSDSKWVLTETLYAHDGITDDVFGDGVGISGDGKTIVVGAAEHDDAGKNSTGAAYIFTEKISADATSSTGDPRELVPTKATKLELHLPFDLDISDIGPFANAVGVGNLVTLSSVKKVGVAAGSFGAGSYVTYPTAGIAQRFSVAFWLYADGTQTSGARLIEAASFRVRLNSTPTQLVFESKRASGTIVPTWVSDRSSIQPGRWHHIAVVYGGTLASVPTMYLNSVPLLNYNTGPAPSGTIDPGSGVTVGGDSTGGPDVSIRGQIDELTFWNTELNRQDIINLMNHVH
ncbi:MAG: hypothetical protein EOP06_07815 [Proteobacteria bacterium]|nr:MAG: hypothetical protein EOP06_07815 [Pseudomonadota bacterium]